MVLCRVGFAFKSVVEIISCRHSDSCKLLFFFSFFPWGLLWVCRWSSKLWPSQNKDISGAITLELVHGLCSISLCHVPGGRGKGRVSYLQILVCTNTRITKFVVVSNQSATWLSLTIRLHFSKRSLSTAVRDIIFTSRTDLARNQTTVVGIQNIELVWGWTRDVLWCSLANANQGYINAAVCDLLKTGKNKIWAMYCLKGYFNFASK